MLAAVAADVSSDKIDVVLLVLEITDVGRRHFARGLARRAIFVIFQCDL